MRRYINFEITRDLLDEQSFNYIVNEIGDHFSPSDEIYLKGIQDNFVTDCVSLLLESQSFDLVREGEHCKTVLITSEFFQNRLKYNRKDVKLDSNTFKICICDPDLVPALQGCTCGGG